MNTLYGSILFLMLHNISYLVFAEGSLWDEEPVWDINLKFPGCGSRIPTIPNALGGITLMISGRESKANSWPWMVGIHKKVGNHASKWVHCGASLISSKFVLTAAHCFPPQNEVDPRNFSVVVGAHIRSLGTEYPVKNIVIHPDYGHNVYYNDIALIELEKQIELSKKVFPVCLPSSKLRNKIERENTEVTMTGWGDTSEGSGRGSNVLQEITIPIVPLKECNTSYGLLRSIPQGIIKDQICAGFQKGGIDSCQGDSGGPVVHKLKDDTYVQLGIVSFAAGCAKPGFPGVSTRVSSYAKWIHDNTDLGKIKSDTLLFKRD